MKKWIFVILLIMCLGIVGCDTVIPNESEPEPIPILNAYVMAEDWGWVGEIVIDGDYDNRLFIHGVCWSIQNTGNVPVKWKVNVCVSWEPMTSLGGWDDFYYQEEDKKYIFYSDKVLQPGDTFFGEMIKQTYKYSNMKLKSIGISYEIW